MLERGIAINQLEDHCTLDIASSTVRFRSTGTTARVFPSTDSQFIIEDDVDADGTRRVMAKRVRDASPGLMFLRASYAMVTLFFVGFLLCFCIQLLLYVILDLAIELGIGNVSESDEAHFWSATGVFLSLPMYIHGLSSALTIGGAYVRDTWQGHPLVKRFVFGNMGAVSTDWIVFIVFVLIPFTSIGITTFMNLPNWWELSSLVWFSCIAIFYILFAANVIWYENHAAWALIKNQYTDDNDSLLHVLWRCIIYRQRSVYSGVVVESYLARGAFDAGRDADIKKQEDTHLLDTTLYGQYIAGWSRLSTDGGLGLFTNLGDEGKKRIYSIEEAMDVRAYLTRSTWSLERIFCRPKHARYIALLQGPDALSSQQMWSTIYCSVVGRFLTLFVLGGLLYWLTGGGFSGFSTALIIVSAVVVFAIRPAVMSSYRLYNMAKSILWGEEDEEAAAATERSSLLGDASNSAGLEPAAALERQEDECLGIYEVTEAYRVYEASTLFCLFMLAIEFFFLFLWPFYSLLKVGSPVSAGIFAFLVFGSACRTYINPAIALEEVGHFDSVEGTKHTKKHWFNASRLATISQDVTRSPAVRFWGRFLCFFLACFVMLFAAAIGVKVPPSDFQFKYLPDFEYKPSHDLLYPTCSFGNDNVGALGTKKANMADFAFVAALAYRNDDITQIELDSWFGEGVAIDEHEYVESYRKEHNVKSQVYFKLISFPEMGNMGLIAIRGTMTPWDALADAQTWSAAMVFQIIRFFLPMSELWTPMMHRLTAFISRMASKTISKVAFYKESTRFALHLKNNDTEKKYGTVQVTGHSLGGGLSMITGAQAEIPAIALSGPNALISRASFDPPVSAENLDRYTFNIVPDRDIVPRFDDAAKSYQKIRCTSPTADVAGCHDGRRSLCEIIFTCGTGDRPALCDCVCEFGYPEPTPKDGVTYSFKDMCKDVATCQKGPYKLK